MPINVTLSDTVHLRDNWSKTVIAAAGISVNLADTVHLREDLVRAIDGTHQQTKYIDDELHLRDSRTHTVIDNTIGISVVLSDTVHLRDSYARNVALGGIWRYIYDEMHLREEITSVTVKQNLIFARNRNISFGETKEPNYKEYSHRFRWTNYNGIAVPDLNYKDLKEPIVRIMPAPSFLQFEYANSFLLFTRNSINRFVLKADVETGQWRAQTDNLIEEFKDYGLMEAKTLVLAGDTLFGLSEKGVWKWNSKGMELISDKIIDLPDAGVYEYIAFYSSIRNQYVLHRQESSGSYLQMTVGTPVSTVKSNQYSETVFITNDKFVSIKYESIGGGYPDDVYVVVGEVSGNSVTYGTPVLVGNCNEHIHIIEMGDDKVLISYNLAVGQKVAVGNISGTTISITGETTVTGGNVYGGFLVKFSDTRFAIFHNRTDYYTGTLSGNTITLDTEQSDWVGANSYLEFKGAYVATGKAFIMYAITAGGATGLCRIIEDNGDGTIAFGSFYNTTVAYNLFGSLDVAVASGTLIFTIFTDNNDIILQPFAVSGNTLTAGNTTTKAGWITNTGAGVKKMGIANKGSSGFWLFYNDKLNSDYLTAMWGSGSATDMALVEATKTVVQSDEAYSVEGIRTPLGLGLLVYNDDGTTTAAGRTSVWGIEYAAIDSFVYQIDRKKWTKFLGMDILDVPVILSGGSLDENYNLWLDSDRQLMKYPGTAYTAVEAVIRTKEFYIQHGLFQRYLVDFEGSADVETRVKRISGGSEVVTEDRKYNVTPNEMRLIDLAKSRGRSMSIKMYNADVISALLFDIKEWGER